LSPKVKDKVSPSIEKIEEPPLEVSSTETLPLPWLTLEALLYALLFLIGLGLRWWRLGAYPMSAVEAGQSLAGLALYRGELAAGSDYSPLVVSLNTLTFFLFGASDATARLGSLLFGSSLVLLPLTLRRQLGSLVSLITAAILAISPTALYLSRTVNAEIAVAAGALLLLAGFLNWVEHQGRQPAWLYLAAAGLALIVTAGPMAYSLLLIFGLLILIKRRTFIGLWDQTLRAGSGPVAPAVLSPAEPADGHYAIPDPAAPRPAAPTPTPVEEIKPERLAQLRQAGLLFVALLFLLGTTSLLNLSGFSLLSGAIGDWLTRFSFNPRPDAGFNAVFLLTLYEPWLVLAGLAGLTIVVLRGNLVATILAGWYIGGLVLDVAMIGRPNSHVILSLVPLAFLAAFALAQLWQSLVDFGSWGNEGLLTLTGLVIAAFGYIGLTAWATRTCAADDLACQYGWLQPVAALVLYTVIAIFFAYLADDGVALRGTAVAALCLGLIMTVAVSWRLNYGLLSRLAYQPLAGIPASSEVVTLSETLHDQSDRRVGDENLLDISLSGVDNPALLWRLRDFSQLTSGGSNQSGPAQAVITPAGASLNLEQPYIGQDFALDAIWSPVGLPGKTLLEWLIYRYVAHSPPQGNRVILWLRVEPN
jgi:uncharacterized protein (TIGR03663 family)